ncbi:MAG: LuxR C-terminal-related transcriptional regulator [Sulfitobacter sp.]
MSNIVIVSPNSFFVEALRHNLALSSFDISECSTTLVGLSGSLMLSQDRCDIVILDFDAYAAKAETEVARIKLARPGLKILAVLQKFDLQQTSTCFQAGCDGVLLSNLNLDSLSHHLTLLQSGHKVFPNQVAQLMCEYSAQQPRYMSHGPATVQFSERQAQVLKLVIDGAQNKSIANRLEMPLTTVKADIKAMMRKTGAQNRTELAICVLRKGWADTAGREAVPAQ